MPERTAQNPLGMRSISEAMNLNYGEKLKETSTKILTWDWIFSHPLEKIIVASSLLWGMFSIGKFVMSLFE